MSDLILRPITEDEFPTVYRVGCVAFGEDVQPDEILVSRRGFDLERSLCVFEGGSLVGTSTAHSMELVVPGNRNVPAGGLTWIAVLPTHRRRGFMSRMVEAQFEKMRSRGEVVAVLLASEGSIYERFGFGPATHVSGFTIWRDSARLRDCPSRASRMLMLEPGAAATELPQLFERLRFQRVGEVSRPAGWWDEYLGDPQHHREGGGSMLHVKHVDAAGLTDGYVTYRLKEAWDHAMPAGKVTVVEIVAADAEVYTDIWDYLLSLDLFTEVSFPRGRADEPLRWMLSNQRGFRVDSLLDYLWVRVLDVPRALKARGYRSCGDLVLEVAGVPSVGRTTRYRLSVDPDGPVECREDVAASPDIRLGIGDLGAVYLGGVSFRSLAMARRVQESNPGALERADALFAVHPAPYCCTMF